MKAFGDYRGVVFADLKTIFQIVAIARLNSRLKSTPPTLSRNDFLFSASPLKQLVAVSCGNAQSSSPAEPKRQSFRHGNCGSRRRY